MSKKIMWYSVISGTLYCWIRRPETQDWVDDLEKNVWVWTLDESSEKKTVCTKMVNVIKILFQWLKTWLELCIVDWGLKLEWMDGYITKYNILSDISLNG